MARIVNSPADIKNYPDNQIVFRSCERPPQYPTGRVVECKWGNVFELDGVTIKYPAEEISFGEAEDGWDKSTSLRLG